VRVLHVTAGLAIESGGPPRVVASLMAPLSRLGIECTVFAPAPRPDAGQLVRPEAADVRLFPPGWLARVWPGHSPQMARELRASVGRFDVVHIHEVWHHPHYAAAVASRRARVPYIISPHGTLAPRALGHKAWKKRVYTAAVQRRLLQGSGVVHAMTEVETQEVRRFRIAAPVAVIPWGIDADKFAALPPPGVFERQHPSVVGKRVVLFMGRLSAVKGLDVLVPAFARAASGRDDLFLVIAGPESGYGTEVTRLIREAGLSHRSAMVGTLHGEDRLAALAAADVFVLPSYSEGFSVAVLEALAAGRPVVITHNCNFPEVAACGAGFVVDPEVGQVGDALASILDQPELASQMGARARTLVEEGYTWDRVAGLFVEMYRSVLAGAET